MSERPITVTVHRVPTFWVAWEAGAGYTFGAGSAIGVSILAAKILHWLAGVL